MSAAAIAIADTLLSGAIQFLIQKQKVDALITQARLENRDVSEAELKGIKATRDMLVTDVNKLLDAVT